MADGTGKVRPAGASPDTAGDAVYMQLTAGQVSTTLQAGEDQTNDVQKVELQYGYETVAASQTDWDLGNAAGGGGATGDFLHAIIVDTATGTIVVEDGTTTVLTIPATAANVKSTGEWLINAVSVNGPWRITTAAGTTCMCIGRFTA